VDFAPFLKEVGRGREGARGLVRADAERLFGAVLDGEVSELQLGAFLIAMRLKSESVEELAGFAAATEARYAHLAAPADGRIPVVLPSYNGARHMPNLLPLLALLLVRAGARVLVHGVRQDSKRVTSCEILAAMGIDACEDLASAESRLASEGCAFVPIEVLAPRLQRVLAMRDLLGVRNSAHTLAKLLQPFQGQALRLVSVTHPEYLVRMREFFAEVGGEAMLLRGAEGEAVANAKRQPQIEWLHEGESDTVVDADEGVLGEVPELPASRDAQTTADWTTAALSGSVAVPPPIERQVDACLEALAAMRTRQLTAKKRK
jgi:anthranilate phosphoribosyltransferase